METKSQQAFLALLRAGLWETKPQLTQFDKIDLKEIYRLAKEQSVVGIVAAGLELCDEKFADAQEDLALFREEAARIEQENIAMNTFIADIISKMRKAGIYALLIKGQSIAQCYERPLARTTGDIDLFLSAENYRRAKEMLIPMASQVDEEKGTKQRLGLVIDSWRIDLHGSFGGGFGERMDQELLKIQEKIFTQGEVRAWHNGEVEVFAPAFYCDIIYVFTHVLQHFFKDGLGLKQVCDWCRLLWYYRYSLNGRQLGKRIQNMGIMTEWEAFGTFAVTYLGMPIEAMPFYFPRPMNVYKAERICNFLFEVGDFGQNRDMSYREKYPYCICKMISFWRHTKDCARHFLTFPWDSVKVWYFFLVRGMKEVRAGRSSSTY